MQLVDKVSNLEETMLQLKENNAELIKLMKPRSNANNTIRNKNCAHALVACFRNEINNGNEIRAMNKKLEKFRRTWQTCVRRLLNANPMPQ